MRRYLLILGFILSTVPVFANSNIELPFAVGETLEYRIHWGLVSVGTSRISTEWVEYEGRQLIAIRLKNRTNGALSKLYPVDDFVESLVDPETFLPVRFIKKLNQGRYHCDEETLLDHVEGVAYWHSNKSGKKKEYAIEAESRDILTFLYHSRLQVMQPDTILKRQLIADEKLYDLEIHCEAIEPVKLSVFGDIDCLRIEPKASFNGIFVRAGRMWMWISRDPRRICTELKSEVLVGKVSLTLDSVTGPGDDFWVSKPMNDGDETPRPRRPIFRRR
jgi:hypothetical protein